MGEAFFYNFTDKTVMVMLNDDFSTSQTIVPIKKWSATQEYYFYAVKFIRDTGPFPHGKFGSLNNISYSVGKESALEVRSVPDVVPQGEDILIFLFYYNIVVKSGDSAIMYTAGDRRIDV